MTLCPRSGPFITKVPSPPGSTRQRGVVLLFLVALRQHSKMYLAGLEKILRAGQALGLAGAELRSYFDNECVKWRAERALNREAMRLGVDAVRLEASGDGGEAILSECEKRKDAHEREIASLKKQVAALQSSTGSVRPDDLSLTSAQEEESKPSRVSHTLGPAKNEHRENRSLFRESVYAGQEIQEQKTEALEDKCGLFLQEVRLLTLNSFSTAGNSNVAVVACHTPDDSVGGPQAEGTPCPRSLGTYTNNETVINTVIPPTVTETSSCSQRKNRKRKNAGKSARQLRKFYMKPTQTIRNSARIDTERDKTFPKIWRKRTKRERKRKRKPQRRRKYDLFPKFQGSPLTMKFIDKKHFTRRRRRRNRGVFHTKVACCPKRKRRRIFS